MPTQNLTPFRSLRFVAGTADLSGQRINFAMGAAADSDLGPERCASIAIVRPMPHPAPVTTTILFLKAEAG